MRLQRAHSTTTFALALRKNGNEMREWMVLLAVFL